METASFELTPAAPLPTPASRPATHHRWVDDASSSGVETLLTYDGDRSIATHQCHRAVTVMGLPLLSVGIHTFRYEIHRSCDNDGQPVPVARITV